MDIQGVCKSTVVRGEDDFPIGVLRVTDCHDTVVYALAPLQYVKIAACSDCQVGSWWPHTQALLLRGSPLLSYKSTTHRAQVQVEGLHSRPCKCKSQLEH